jgi:4-hydroxy-2-oxoheptanedioate aldolase
MASVLNKANTLRTALHTGSGLSFGAWQMLPGSYLSRTIARAGYDWICIDCEHGNIAGKDQESSLQRTLELWLIDACF